MEQEREDNLDKITNIYIYLYTFAQSKKRKIYWIKIKNTITEFVDWTMKTINKNILGLAEWIYLIICNYTYMFTKYLKYAYKHLKKNR